MIFIHQMTIERDTKTNWQVPATPPLRFCPLDRQNRACGKPRGSELNLLAWSSQLGNRIVQLDQLDWWRIEQV